MTPLDRLEKALTRAGVRIVVDVDGGTRLAGNVGRLTPSMLEKVKELKGAILERAGKSGPVVVMERPEAVERKGGCESERDGYWPGSHDGDCIKCGGCGREYCQRCAFVLDVREKCPKCGGKD